MLVVQSKREQDGELVPSLSTDEKGQYNVWRTLSIESSLGKTKGGFGLLQSSIEEIIAEQVQNSCREIPVQWYTIREQIAARQQQGEKQMPLDVFKAMCQQSGLDESSSNTLLHYLHNTGVFFYKKGLFNNLIVLDQKWAINAVYILFDRKGYFARIHNRGEFGGIDLQEAWSGYGLDEQELFISFMKECAICFEVNETANQDKNTPLAERRYIAPQLLPETKPALIDLLFDGEEEVCYKYQHRFLHAAVLQRFMVSVGFLAKLNEMWKEGMLIRTNEGAAIIEAVPDKHQLLIRVKGAQKQALLAKIKGELTVINKDDLSVVESVSLNGKSFVALKQLAMHPGQNAQVQADDGTWVPFHDYRQFLPDHKNEGLAAFRNETAEVTKQQKNAEIFLSYAWGEEARVNALCESLQQDGYKLIRDKQALGYKDLISDFMLRMSKGDLIIVLIGDKYLRSRFCMHELYEIYRNAKLQKDEVLKRILPIWVQPINLSDPKVLRGYFEHWTHLEKEWRDLVNNYGADQGEHRKVEAIKNAVRDLLPFISDINALTIEQLSAGGFQLIKTAIAKRMKVVNTQKTSGEGA